MAGVPTVPRPWLERTLSQALPDGPARRPRIVRLERSRALVEVGHLWAGAARTAWNRTVPGPGGGPVTIATRATWGTLRKGKLWLRAERPGGPDR